MKIIRLEAENVKRLKAVEIVPRGNVVTIAGKNGQGKSSTLDAIEMALGGAGTIPPEPVRRGARKASIVVDLGDIVVERTFSAKGTALRVRSKDGTEQKSPQALLDSLCSRVAFDPLEFARMEPKKQDEVLKRLLNLDFSELDRERAEAFQERASENKAAKDLKARVDAAPFHGDAPAEETSVAELMAELKRRQGQVERANALNRAVEQAENERAHARLLVERTNVRIADLERQLAEERKALEAYEREVTTGEANVSRAREERDAFTYDQPHEVEEQLATVEETNRKVRENAARATLKVHLRLHEANAEELTAKIEELDARKARMLEDAQFPVIGLGFDDAGPTLNGIPLEQASQAERLRVSVAIGLALNPKLKVLLVRDGSLLDDDSMRLLAEMAAEHDAQVWVERVGAGDPTAIVIEDGEVKVDGTAPEAAIS
jgi:energy-coupling factor transporter ATP-binding protein EcfA2